MKTTRLFIIAAASLLMLGCTKELEQTPEEENTQEVNLDQDLTTMTFKAKVESTKTSVDINGSTATVSWDADDAVKFFWRLDSVYGDAVSTETTLNGDEAVFTTAVPADFAKTNAESSYTTRNLYAVYPASANMYFCSNYDQYPGSNITGVVGNLYVEVPSQQTGLFKDASIAVSRWDAAHPDNPLQFNNLCGLLQVTISDASVKYIEVTGEENIAGLMNVTMIKSGFLGIPIEKTTNGLYDGTNKITVTIQNPTANETNYYIAVRPCDINNLYVSLYDSNYDLIGDKVSGNTLSVARRQIRKLGALDAGFDSNRFFVKVDGTGDGTTWEDAADLSKLKTLLNGSTGKNVYIAKGTYTFSSNFASNSSSSVKFNVYGGFPDNSAGQSLAGRDISNNETIFDGQEQYRLWVLQRGTFVIDGITFYRAARLSSGSNDTGSALVVEKASSQSLNVTVSNCTFQNNKNEKMGGGAVRIGGSTNPVIMKKCTFKNNSATSNGGAIYVTSGGRSVKLIDCTFSSNTAEGAAGAIYCNAGTVNAYNCKFSGNQSTSYGGGIVSSDASVIRLNQCTFTDNKSTSNSSADLYIAGTSSIFANMCYFGQTTTTLTPATSGPLRILTGVTTTSGWNNCVISGPFGKSVSQNQFGGYICIVNSTIYTQVSGAAVYSKVTDSDGCRVINSIVINGSSGQASFKPENDSYIHAYNTVYSKSTTSTTGVTNTTDCVSDKYYDNFPDSSPWAQKSIGAATTLPAGSAIRVYNWGGVCDGFTRNSLGNTSTEGTIKALVNGTTTVGPDFLSWLESDELKIDGVEALALDIRGKSRNTSSMWPGSYQN